MALLQHLIVIVLCSIYNTTHCIEIITCTGANNECICDPARVGEECILNCDGIQLCVSDALTCRDNDPCTINCNQIQACKSSLITCPANSDCIINCQTGNNVCQSITINTNGAKNYQFTGTCSSCPMPYTTSPTSIPTTFTNNPTTSTPTTTNPTTTTPTTTTPTTISSTTAAPTTVTPTTTTPTASPTTAIPTINSPTTSTPTTTMPTTSTPTTANPTTTMPTITPTTSTPTTANPTTTMATITPTTTTPTTAMPTTSNPTTANPTTIMPTTAPTTSPLPQTTQNSPKPSKQPSVAGDTSRPTNVPSKEPTISPTDITNLPSTTPDPTKSPTKKSSQSPTNEPTFDPTIKPIDKTRQPTPTYEPKYPSAAPTKCSQDLSLTNEGCTDNRCADSEDPYLDIRLAFSVCKKKPFVGRRYGLWNAVVNCLCYLSKNGNNFDYSNPVTRRRRLGRGDNKCDYNVLKYDMEFLIETVSTNCNTTGFRFFFAIEGCGDCVTLTQGLKKIKDMETNDVYNAVKRCTNWYAKQVDTIGFDGVYDVELNIRDEFGSQCDIITNGVNNKCYNIFVVICMTLVFIIVS